MKKSWIWIAALLLILGLSSEAGATGSEEVETAVRESEVGTEGAHPPKTDEKYFIFDASKGAITGYSNEGPKAVVIPATIRGALVRKIEAFAFVGKGLTSVTLPEGLVEIGESAFHRNELINVKFPDSLEMIGSSAFINNKLRSVLIPSKINKLGLYVFAYNELISMTLPEGLVEIGEGCFLSNKLTTIEFPSSLQRIKRSAFEQNKLLKVSLPNGLKEIGEYAFNSNKLTGIILPETLETVRKGTFYNNQLNYVNLPSGVKRIEEKAFRKNSFPQISIPKGCTWHEEAFDPKVEIFILFPMVKKRDSTLTVRFNKDLGQAVAGEVILSLIEPEPKIINISMRAEGKTLTVTPSEVLNPGGLYLLTLKKTIRSRDGKTMKYPVRVYFKYLK